MEANLDLARSGAETLVVTCGVLGSADKALVVCDDRSEPAAEIVAERARAVAGDVRFMTVDTLPHTGAEPPGSVADAMSWSTVCFGMTTRSMAHTHARLEASAAGMRYLSLPDYSIPQLASPALRVDYSELEANGCEIRNILSAASRVRLRAPAGTDLELDVQDRRASYAGGVVTEPGDLSSPPNVETNIGPDENGARGILVVDGSVPGVVGVLPNPIEVEFENGVAVRITGGREADALSAALNSQPREASHVAELGIGLNPDARLSGRMLEDEGALGTVHVGLGSSTAFGGVNDVPFHVDLVCAGVTLETDTGYRIADGSIAGSPGTDCERRKQ